MRCQNCGNELGLEEVFCGQCGTPTTGSARPTKMVQTPPPRSGLLRGAYHDGMPSSLGSFRSAPVPPSENTQAPHPLPIQPEAPQIPQAPRPLQTNNFYRDATEAMSFTPGSLQAPHQSPHLSQASFNSLPAQGGIGQFAPPTQAFQTGNHPGTLYSHPQSTFPTGQVAPGYGFPPAASPHMTPPPPQRGSHTVLIIACICLACAVIAVGSFGAFFLLRDNSSKNHAASIPTAAITPTTAPSPTAIPSPSPSPLPSPSPAAVATPAPDANFTWCDTSCTLNGFLVEYPNGWQQGSTADHTGTQFTDPNAAQHDVYAAFKTPGATSSSASELVNQDLNAFATQQGYIAPTTSSTATIGGENWVYEKANYQLNGQVERIVVYATVHGGKAYIIELEAQDPQFDSVNMQDFEAMIGRFQFWPPPTP